MNIDAVQVPGFYPDHETVRSDIADYYWEVQRWDRDVGAALAQLEKIGELENTIVVMTGDHGMPFPRCKGNLYDWGARVPMAIRWGARVKVGRRVSDFVSLTDLAPTFLSAAGVDVPMAMTGKSLLSTLSASKEGRVDVARASVVFGRERHVPAQKMPSIDGYPSRALRTDRWLLIMNFVPTRWPAGVAEGATHSINMFADCDAGPTKAFLMEHQGDGKLGRYFDLAFAKRPAVELYDCQADPYQVKNLADDPSHAETLEQLRKQLADYLVATADPRFVEPPAKFDTYPYRGGGLNKRLKGHGRK
jgi:N-sulfoglucosamine sulfohydrolase